MIGKLKGVIDSIYNEYLIIDVNSVGYIVYCSSHTLSKINVGDFAELIIETHVREEYIKLYGFYNYDEKNSFVMLLSVKGVGGKLAMTILSHLSPEQINHSLYKGDNNSFSSVPGVGKKTAERLVMELKYKILDNKDFALASVDGLCLDQNIINDATAALVKLGLTKNEVQQRIQKIIQKNPSVSLDNLIKLSLVGDC